MHRLEIIFTGTSDGSELDRARILGASEVLEAATELERGLAAAGIAVEVKARWVKPSEGRKRAAMRPRPVQAAE